MNASFKKRFFGYFIDMVIVLGISLIFSIIFTNKNVNILNNELNVLFDNLLGKNLNTTNALYQFSDIIYGLSKEQVLLSVVNAFIIIGYFVFIPYFTRGVTLGMKLNKIKIIKNDNTEPCLNDLIFRSFINQGLITLLLSLATVYFMPSFIYFIFVSILAFIQILLVIISAFMILYRKDKLGLQDIISKTKIIVEVEK